MLDDQHLWRTTAPAAKGGSHSITWPWRARSEGLLLISTNHLLQLSVLITTSRPELLWCLSTEAAAGGPTQCGWQTDVKGPGADSDRSLSRGFGAFVPFHRGARLSARVHGRFTWPRAEHSQLAVPLPEKTVNYQTRNSDTPPTRERSSCQKQSFSCLHSAPSLFTASLFTFLLLSWCDVA